MTKESWLAASNNNRFVFFSFIITQKSLEYQLLASLGGYAVVLPPSDTCIELAAEYVLGWKNIWKMYIVMKTMFKIS